MIEHRVEITDSFGRSMRVLIRLAANGTGAWRTLDKGYICYEEGIVDTGNYPTSPLAWLALYGGNQIDDANLVLHLDNFLSATTISRAGKGKVYKQDYLIMQPGEVSWQLIS